MLYFFYFGVKYDNIAKTKFPLKCYWTFFFYFLHFNYYLLFGQYNVKKKSITAELTVSQFITLYMYMICTWKILMLFLQCPCRVKQWLDCFPDNMHGLNLQINLLLCVIQGEQVIYVKSWCYGVSIRLSCGIKRHILHFPNE